jgi:hypothetical protein
VGNSRIGASKQVSNQLSNLQ